MGVQTKAHVHSFWTAQTALGNRDCRKIANNTELVRLSHDVVGLKLHQTVIIKYRLDGSVVLNSGGWQTVTTKARFNQFLPEGLRVSQEDFEWSVSEKDGPVPFEDGMVVWPESQNAKWRLPGT